LGIMIKTLKLSGWILVCLAAFVLPCLHALFASHPSLLTTALTFKIPITALGLLLILFTPHFPKHWGFASLLLFSHFLLSFFWRGHHPAAAQSAALTLACTFAFGIGLMRLAPPRALIFTALALSIAAALADLLALWPAMPTGFIGARNLTDAIASCFENRHAFAAFMLVGLFACLSFIDMPSTTTRPPVWLFAAALITLCALLLSDSRSAQGTFFLLLFPTLFLSLRLDFKEPHPERLAWVAAATLGAGLIWLNLPDRQWHATAHVFTENPLDILQQREAAKAAFVQSPWFGQGTGSYPWAARAMLPTLMSGDKTQSATDSIWQELQVGLDEAKDQADLALNPGPLPSAASHPLQMLAEIGFVGYALELAIFGLALFALFREALRYGTPSARFMGLALLGLFLHGLFTPALEEPVIRMIYFALIGYGASYAARATDQPDLNTVTGRLPTLPTFEVSFVLRVAAVVAWVFTAWLVTTRWQADRVFQATLAKADDPKSFTDGMVRILGINPYHVEATYAYAQILVRFGRKVEALGYIDRMERFAPDPPRQDLARASIQLLSGSPHEATRLLTPWLHRRHPPMPALEMTTDIYAGTRQCEPLRRLLADSTRFRRAFPKPDPELYTPSHLQREFMRGEEVNFLQRWFAGRALRKRFADRRLAIYHRALETHQRLEKVLQIGCESNELESGDFDSGKGRPQQAKPRPFMQLKG
jgi:O-antigen ligase